MSYQVITHADVHKFLEAAQAWMEAEPIHNALPLGISLGVARAAEPASDLLFKTVQDEQGIVLAALRTPPFKLVVIGKNDVRPEPIQALLEDLDDQVDELPGVLGPAPVARQFVQQCRATYPGEIYLNRVNRLFELQEVTQSPLPPGSMRLAEALEESLVGDWFYQFQLEAMGEADLEAALSNARNRLNGGNILLWDDGGPVSMAGKTRPTKHQVAIGPVYTPPEFRRKGYASALVAALSQSLLDQGFPRVTLFTDTKNPTANHIYQKIGFHPVEDFDEYTFIGA